MFTVQYQKDVITYLQLFTILYKYLISLWRTLHTSMVWNFKDIISINKNHIYYYSLGIKISIDYNTYTKIMTLELDLDTLDSVEFLLMKLANRNPNRYRWMDHSTIVTSMHGLFIYIHCRQIFSLKHSFWIIREHSDDAVLLTTYQSNHI